MQINFSYLLQPLPKPPSLQLTVNEAKNAGIRQIVKQSILGAESGLDVAPLRLHRQAEKIIEFGIPFTFLRPNSFDKGERANTDWLAIATLLSGCF
jgi:uncharacterized protein YbjT (DUF2867 family)